MGVKYAAGFSVSLLRDGVDNVDHTLSITLTRATFTDVVITHTAFAASSGSALSCHGYDLTSSENHEGVAMYADYAESFAEDLQGAITAGMAAQSWTGAITVTFASNRYTIASDGFSFAITFGHEASAYLLGFATTSSASAASHVGTYTPTYWIDATLDGRSLDAEGDFEPGEIASLAVSDDATAYAGISRSTSPKYRSWWQQFEIKRKVFKSAASGADRWTFEHLFEHCRCHYPFVVYDGVETMVCVFLSEGSSFSRKQRPGGAGDDVHLSIPFTVWHAADITA